jgi:hypothetical protein
MATIHSGIILIAFENYKAAASSFLITQSPALSINTLPAQPLQSHSFYQIITMKFSTMLVFPALAFGAATPKLPVSSIDPACLESITSVADCIKNLKPTGGAAALTDIATW